MNSDTRDDVHPTKMLPGGEPDRVDRVTGSEAGHEEVPEHTLAGFPVVGIGASAGGLAAFEEFFSGMPADKDPGMAFILVQHLAPDHKSMLTELIGRYTRMHVYEVEDGMVVQPNCAYIIPPNRDMAFMNGSLQLREPAAPRGQRTPIDSFFRSLAQALHERAICIVLSGTGSDGTMGVRAIKGEGGMVMVQSLASTEYDGMPRSALDTGLVDFELPPAQMPPQLIAYVARAFGDPSHPDAPGVSMPENALQKIFLLLRNHTTHDFSQYKLSTIKRRIERRMAVQQVASTEEYVRFLQQTPPEVLALFRDLLIGVTSFFRDPAAFKVLEDQVLPRLFAEKHAGATIRVWCPGCSTGEEAYSLAILLAERQEAMKLSYKIQIFATDIDSQSIASARAGFYPETIAADVTQERLARFFSPEPGGRSYRIHKVIRDLLVFSEQDVIKDPPFSRLDLISCRNLLIYMNGDLQRKIIPLFHYALRPGGYLFLGTSENVAEFGDIFSVLDRKQKVFQRKERFHGSYYAQPDRSLPPAMVARSSTAPGDTRGPGLTKLPWREITEQALLHQTAPAAALVNTQGTILYLHGRTGLYLEPAQGETGVFNILKMAREGLRRDLTSALQKAFTGHEVVRSHAIRVKTNGDYTSVDLTVHPVGGTLPATGAAGDIAPEMLLFLVTLGPAISDPAHLPDPGEAAGTHDATAASSRLSALEQELRAKEEYLQTTIEELETTNEELKSSNEEMQSVNEELQSTNEELETSKEELQSVNEELATVNAELQTKVVDLSRANNDMNNLLAGTGIGTVFVDHDLHILRFTPAATRIINLIQSDVGRPVGHLVSNLTEYDALSTDIREVLTTLIPKEVEVHTKAGAWYTMRIQPYRTLENVIEGAVITFVDISGMKKSQEVLRETEARFRLVLQASPVIVAQIDRDLRYTWIHDPHPGALPASVLGKRDDEIADNSSSRKLVQLKRRAVESGIATRERISFLQGEREMTLDIAVEPLRDDRGVVIGATTVAFETASTRTGDAKP